MNLLAIDELAALAASHPSCISAWQIVRPYSDVKASHCVGITCIGIGQMSEVEAVILETDGSFSILRATAQPVTTALNDVNNYPSPST
jgi:hypothetical protein